MHNWIHIWQVRNSDWLTCSLSSDTAAVKRLDIYLSQHVFFVISVYFKRCGCAAEQADNIVCIFKPSVIVAQLKMLQQNTVYVIILTAFLLSTIFVLHVATNLISNTGQHQLTVIWFNYSNAAACL